MFVSWCANQAGIPTSVIRKNGFANASAFGLTDIYKAKDRTPKPGDLLFKNDNSHVGIVYYVSGDYVYTIEGNTSNTSSTGVAVLIRKRELSGKYYFASPQYQSDTDHNYVKGNETAHPHKEYYKCSDCSSKYYTGRTGTVDTCQECIMANCTHKYGTYTKTDNTYHTGVCTLCTKQTKFKHEWGSDEVVKEATCENTGLKNQTCAQCGATRQTSIPQTNDHQYGDWEYIDGDKHTRTCQSCNRSREEAHTQSAWQYDGQEHWYTCADCGGRAGLGQHDLKNGCASTCPVCKYEGGGHVFAAVWSQDAQGHWYACVYCDVKVDVQPHTFSTNCDESCDDCGYIRQTQHTYEETWTSDSAGHYHACTECGKPQQVLEHQPGDPATEQNAQRCTVCQYEIAPMLEHIHNYAPYKSDGQTHWGFCHCGAVMAPESHTWDMATGQCSVCGSMAPVPEEDPIPWMIILPAVAGSAVLLALLIALGMMRKRRKAKLAAALQQELSDSKEEDLQEAVPV